MSRTLKEAYWLISDYQRALQAIEAGKPLEPKSKLYLAWPENVLKRLSDLIDAMEEVK